MPRLLIVSPCYNEVGGIEQFYRNLRRQLDLLNGIDAKVLIVDDGSSDGTLGILNSIADTDARLLVCALSRNFGHQAALSAGLDMAVGDAVILMDSDLQHPPELIPQMVELWRRGNDVVQAVRQDTAGVSRMKKVCSGAFYTLFNWLSDTQLVPGAADFCLLSERAHRVVVSLPERRRFLRGLVSWIGFDRALVPYSAPARATGTSKYTLTRMLGFAFDAVVSFSPKPLTVAMRFGLGIAAMGGAYLIYSILIYFITGDAVAGWTSLICTMLILGGVNLLFIGLIGEYLARVLDETKGRPVYVLKQKPPLPAFGAENSHLFGMPHSNAPSGMLYGLGPKLERSDAENRVVHHSEPLVDRVS